MPKLTRREFLGRSGVLLGVAAAGAVPGALLAQSAPTSASSSRPGRRPNILLIVTDDQRFDALSCVQRLQGDKGRFPWLKTPHMDRLGASGLLMTSAFCITSLCSPSRACMLTGRYGHANGVLNNSVKLPATETTWAALLKAAGYRTGYFGKWHMDSQTDRPGFEQSVTYVGQGEYLDCPLLINGARQPSKGWLDDVITDHALEFMGKSSDKPFAAMVGYESVHGPWLPPERRKDAYGAVEPRGVPNLDTPAIYKSAGLADKAGAQDKHLQPMEPKAVQNYFQTLQAVDDNVGRVLDALEKSGQFENTLIIFVSDNGFYLGEHGLRDKRSAYEESVRIPMLVSYGTRIKPGVCDAMALNVDIGPTILDAAGVKLPEGMHGQSLLGVLTGQRASLRSSFLYIYKAEPQYPGTPSMVAVRTTNAKLVTYPGHKEWTEVFDLSKDPYETRNLADDAGSAQLRKELETELARLSKSVGFERL